MKNTKITSETQGVASATSTLSLSVLGYPFPIMHSSIYKYTCSKTHITAIKFKLNTREIKLKNEEILTNFSSTISSIFFTIVWIFFFKLSPTKWTVNET